MKKLVRLSPSITMYSNEWRPNVEMPELIKVLRTAISVLKTVEGCKGLEFETSTSLRIMVLEIGGEYLEVDESDIATLEQILTELEALPDVQ